MILNGNKMNYLIKEMKQTLEKKTGYVFSKESNWEFEFLKDEKIRKFELEYDFNTQQMWISFNGCFWEEDENETLAKIIYQTIIDFLVQKNVDCFIQCENSYYFDEEEITGIERPYIYEFRFSPIGEKAKIAMEILSDMPVEKHYYSNRIYLNENIYYGKEIEVIPTVEGDPGVKLVMRDSKSSSNHQKEYELENTIDVLCSKESYSIFIKNYEDKYHLAKDMELELIEYAKEKGLIYDESRNLFKINQNYYSLHVRYNFGEELHVSSLKTSYYISQKEELEKIKREIELVAKYEKNLAKFLEKLQNEITTLVYSKESYDDNYKMYIGEEFKYVRITFNIEKDYYSLIPKASYETSFEGKREKYEDEEKMFEALFQTLKKEDRKIKLRDMFKTDKVEHLTRVLHECGLENKSISVLFGKETGLKKEEVDLALKQYYGENPLSKLDNEKQIHHFGKVELIIEKEKQTIKFEKAG